MNDFMREIIKSERMIVGVVDVDVDVVVVWRACCRSHIIQPPLYLLIKWLSCSFGVFFSNLNCDL